MQQKHTTSLSNMFRGGIAGAMLGYLIGRHYTLTNYQRTDKRLIGSSLDWSWLAGSNASSDIVQAVLTCFFSIGHESFWTQPPQSWGKNRCQDVNEFSYRHTINVHDANESIIPILDMLGVLNHLLEHHPVSFVKDGPESTALASPIVSKHPLQSAFILLPLFLLYHDNIAQQQGWIESILEYWQHPKAWNAEVRDVGLTLAQAMKDDATASPSHYEMGLLGLLNQPDRSKDDWTILPLMMGLDGSVLGCKVGFSKLPLIWHHTIVQHTQSLRAKTYASQKHDVGGKLMALWSGQQKRLETWHPTTSCPRVIP